MKKISLEIAKAFYKGKHKKIGNTETDGQHIYLYKNLIARKRMVSKEIDCIYIANFGWDTKTTNDRLNALRGVKITHKNGNLLLNGKNWDGNWIKII